MQKLRIFFSFLEPVTFIFLFWLLVAGTEVSAQNSQGSTPSPSKGSGTSQGGSLSNTKVDMSQANPEDITNENFPDIIDSFDFQNTDLVEVIKAMNKLTGKNIILDNSKIRGKITILAPSKITVAEAYKAFLSALAMNGLTIVPSGKFLKIMSAKDAQKNSIETYTEYFPNTDQMITRIIRLKYISAEEVQRALSRLKSRSGEMQAYGPTNSIIITDYGSNIQRISGILDHLDVPGFEEQLTVIRIEHAKAKEISSIIDKIINKGSSGRRSGSSRFRRRSKSRGAGGQSGSESYSLVVPDDRSNSIIVMGNKAGIIRIKKLVKKLDFPLNPEDAGGVYVYYVRHVKAKQIADVLSGIAADVKSTKRPGGNSRRPQPSSSGNSSLFGGDVKITADEVTNSLVVTASKQDYAIVKGLLAKLDISRDQVFVKTIIMEMDAQRGSNWGVNYFKFDHNSNGLGRVGFGTGTLADFANPLGGAGAILGFGDGETFELQLPTGKTATIPSLLTLIHFLKTHVGGNILSQPQIMAVDNEEATIEVGQEVPVGTTTTSTTTGNVQSIERKQATIKLTITPFISPDTDSVMMNIDQQVKQVSQDRVQASQLANAAVTLNTRAIKTSIVVDSGDTAVLGGLMQDQESEQVNKVPLLGDIPLLGWLFKGRKIDRVKKNLLVFITPKVVRMSQDNSDLLNEKLNERLDFIKTYMKGKDYHKDVIENLPRKSQENRLSSEEAAKEEDLFEDEDGRPAVTETF